MRWLAAFGAFILVLTLLVFLFPILRLDGPWSALGTILDIFAAVAVLP